MVHAVFKDHVRVFYFGGSKYCVRISLKERVGAKKQPYFPQIPRGLSASHFVVHINFASVKQKQQASHLLVQGAEYARVETQRFLAVEVYASLSVEGAKG